MFSFSHQSLGLVGLLSSLDSVAFWMQEQELCLAISDKAGDPSRTSVSKEGEPETSETAKRYNFFTLNSTNRKSHSDLKGVTIKQLVYNGNFLPILLITAFPPEVESLHSCHQGRIHLGCCGSQQGSVVLDYLYLRGVVLLCTCFLISECCSRRFLFTSPSAKSRWVTACLCECLQHLSGSVA